jgi:L-lactate dehydrogenase complex protein LldF
VNVKPVDQARNALAFLEDKDQTASFHNLFDEGIWALRERRDAAAREVPEWEQLRDLASQIKEHTLSNLGDYLELFEANAQRNGVHVHWARDGHEHNQIVLDILASHGVKQLVKSKSMLTEECDTRAFLGRRGIEVTETDLGERIQQLDHQPPAHIIGPAAQKTPQDVAELFHRVYGSDPQNAEPVYLAHVMREHTRPVILEAGAGMTGGNFAVAQTGAIVTVTEEGNADLSANVPKLRICSVGIEKVIPGVEELAVFIRLLARSALGMRITQYTSHFAAPRAGGEMHIVLVDNGRSQRLSDERFWPSLKCIRCGACMNTCPVYRRSGGLSYGATYMGPIGIIMMPSYDLHRYHELPFSSTINGSCSNVCPVEIDIHEQIYDWREEMSAKGEYSVTKKAAMRVADAVLSNPKAYRAASEVGETAMRVLPHFAIYNRLNAWGRRRDVPSPVTQTFHQWWARNRGDGVPPADASSERPSSETSG